MGFLRGVSGAFWVLCACFLVWSWWTPIPFRLLKMGSVAALCILVFLPFVLFREARWPRVLAIVTLVLSASIGFWPAQKPDQNELRSQNWRSLWAYRGTPYVWGGENARGIDCSGLIRRAWMEANFQAGLRTQTFSLWREAVAVWWNDCSAREMSAGYGGKIVPLFAASSLNEVKASRLQNGDLAVTQDGVHVLAYAGNSAWIQADPNLANGGDKVIVVSAPSKNGWFGMPVHILRWRALTSETP